MAGLDNPVGGEPPDVFCGLGSLIVEGRVRREKGRGYGEGPHAPPNPGSLSTRQQHSCSVDNPMCKKDENFRKHMLLLWQNNVPVSIEVLLCSDCRVSQQKANSVEYSTIPEPGSILLEQWTVSIKNSRTPSEKLITSRGLFQAVRSYLHFSQLSAWYSSSGGKKPTNVLCRITIPGEAFASKFPQQPEVHFFPQAAVGRNATVNVKVKSHPRIEEIPRVICCHDQVTPSSPSGTYSPTSSPTSDASFRSCSSCSDEDGKLGEAVAISRKDKNPIKTAINLRKVLVKSRLGECSSSTMLSRSDSMDSMLGDSLLDPPQSLEKMPPKRYQSPSRCGSPSLEAPDHLLLGQHGDQYNPYERSYRRITDSSGSCPESDSTSSRCTRQDLLRRRDTTSFHGLHPRLLHLGGHQPRLSLAPGSSSLSATLSRPSVRSNGPYRAFPPERITPRTVRPRTTGGHDCARSEDVAPGVFCQCVQVKCSIPGKHICVAGKTTEDQHRLSRWDVQHQHSQYCQTEDDLYFELADRREEKACPPDAPSRHHYERPSVDKESDETSVFSIGGARKKRSLEGLHPRKALEEIKTSNCHEEADVHDYRDDNDDDDGEVEVAEYVKLSEIGVYPFLDDDENRQKALEREYESIRSACSSRRSSAKEEDLMALKKKGNLSKNSFSSLLEPSTENLRPNKSAGDHDHGMPANLVTQVFRAETATRTTPFPPYSNMISQPFAYRTKQHSGDSGLDEDSSRSVKKTKLDNMGLLALKDAMAGTNEPTNQIEASKNEDIVGSLGSFQDVPIDTVDAACGYSGQQSHPDKPRLNILSSCSSKKDSTLVLSTQTDQLNTKTDIQECKQVRFSKVAKGNLSDVEAASPTLQLELSFSKLNICSNIKGASNKAAAATPTVAATTHQPVLKAKTPERPRSYSENMETYLLHDRSEALACDNNGKRGGSIRSGRKRHLEPLDISFDHSDAFDSCTKSPVAADLEEDEDTHSPDEESFDNEFASIELERENSGSAAKRENGIPTTTEMDSFRKTLTSATTMVFHRRTGLPLSSSPAPLRKGKNNFGFDSSISRPSDIKRALFQSQVNSTPEKEKLKPSNEGKENEGSDVHHNSTATGRRRHPSKKILSASAPSTITSNNLLGSFEESVLNGRLEPVSTVQGFSAEIGASGSFHPKHRKVPVTVFFYTLCENSSISSPYLGHINIGKKGYRVPPKGTLQVTLFNPLGTVVKMFVVMYDLSDMPPNSQTFLRQRTLYMPSDISQAKDDCSTQKWLRYLIHMRLASSKSGKLYLHTDIRMIIFRKSDLDTATDFFPGKGFELRSFTKGPTNPKFSPRR